jgi:hypothetical protein
VEEVQGIKMCVTNMDKDGKMGETGKTTSRSM